MTMPEATMHEDDRSQAREYQIWRSRKVFRVKPESIPHAMSEPSNDHLGFVSFDRTRLMMSLRFSGENLSMSESFLLV